MVKIAYVVYNERPGSGLMRTQVLSLLKQIRRSASDVCVDLVAYWQPWVAWKFRREIRAMRAELAEAGVRQRDIPWALIPSRHFLYSVRLLPVLRTWVCWLFHATLGRRYDIVHCRGYLPSLIAAQLKPRLGHGLIFDLRSFWPREHVTIGAWKEGEPIHRLWEQLETFTLESADASIGVSRPMVGEMLERVPKSHPVLIPICVDLSENRHDPAARERLRRELGWSGNIVIGYQGSLGLMNSNLAEVSEYLALLAARIPGVRFLILTPNRSVDIDATLRRCGVPAGSYAVRHPARGELAQWMSAADAGIHAMSAGPDSSTRLGVKVVEYLSCSLPIIVNPHVGAAAELVRTYQVGAVIEASRPDEAEAAVRELLTRLPVPAVAARRVAEEQFAVSTCAARYLDLYRSIGARAR
jgi:glycosyltransferase involved in cell wall biosynthesis